MISDPHRILSGRQILVVEDERLIALDLRDILEGWGCSVQGPVGTADAALKLIEGDQPDCAVLDVQLIGETSEPVAAALRAAARPFLIMTAFERDHLTGALHDAPLLSKPLDETRLGQELCALLPAGS